MIDTMWQLYKVLEDAWHMASCCGTVTWATNQLADYSFMSTAICHGFRPNEISSGAKTIRGTSLFRGLLSGRIHWLSNG